MARTFGSIATAEMNGNNELDGTSGSPTIVTSPVMDGIYCWELTSGDMVELDNNRIGAAAPSNDHYAGFKFRFTDTTPGSDTQFWRAEEAGTTILNLTLKTDGTIDVGYKSGSPDNISPTLTNDTNHAFEIWWQLGASSNIKVYVDGTNVLDTTSKDTGTAAFSNYEYFYPGATGYVDSMFSAWGISAASDLLTNGSKVWVFSKAHNNTAEDATDQGSTLDSGSWANASEIAANDSNEAIYTASTADGHTRMDEGTRSGPRGLLTGKTAILGWHVARLKRASGGGTTHEFSYGRFDSVDTTDHLTDTGESLATGYADFWFIDTTNFPADANDDFAVGMTVSGNQDMHIGDFWSMILYTESVSGTQDISPTAITSDESVPNPQVDMHIDLVGNAISGAESFGTAVFDMNIDLVANAIGSDESIGTAVLTTGPVDIAPTAITSDESVPNPQVDMHIDLVGNGIISDESVPNPVLDMNIDLTGNGITSDEFVSSPQLEMNIDLTGNAITSDESVGTPALAAVISATSITSDENVPSPQLDMNIDLAGNGISSDENVPGPLVELDTQEIILTTGIGSQEAVPSPQVDLIIDVTGITSDESVPSPQINMNVDLAGNAITSDENIPSPQVDMNINLAGNSITSDENVPEPVLAAGAVDIAPNAIGSDESIGSHVLTPGAVDIAPTAITSNESVPSPQLDFIIFPSSVITEEAFGTPVLTTGPVDISPPSIISEESIGGHLVTLGGPADVGGRHSIYAIFRIPRIPKL